MVSPDGVPAKVGKRMKSKRKGGGRGEGQTDAEPLRAQEGMKNWCGEQKLATEEHEAETGQRGTESKLNESGWRGNRHSRRMELMLKVAPHLID